MTDAPLPQNVYRLAQKEFDAIPGSPWVYWLETNIRKTFQILGILGEYAYPKVGLQTGENIRFIRFWWETGIDRVEFRSRSTNDFFSTNKKWFPYMKGGGFIKWYGNQKYIVNWENDGNEIRNFIDDDGKLRSRPQNTEYYLKEGITYSYLTSGTFSTRYSPGGYIFDVAGSSLFPDNILLILAIMNSKFAGYVLKLINPTVNFQVGDLARIPIPRRSSPAVEKFVKACIQLSKHNSTLDENTFDFIFPLNWEIGLQGLARIENRLSSIEDNIDDEVYRLYDISVKDRAAINTELAGGFLSSDEEDPTENKDNETETIEADSSITLQELAVCWVSYAIGIVLSRFRVGISGAPGSAIYRRDDFAIGSLPAPDEVEFDELVGSADQFAYVDGNGGRHIFPAQVEQALQGLALPDGIAVFDEGHPRDLPTLVEKALNLMLGEQAALEVIREATGGDSSTSLSASPSTSLRAGLRKFLEKDFFTGWHFKWYRKRPVYWPVQSSKRSYGFVLFHEKITRDTFYTIQREPYLDTKRNAVALKMADLQAGLARATGTTRKKLERELDDLRKLAEELAEFAKELEAITLGGYEPEPDWIDDGVILRMAPLWKVIPIWKSEPKKYWDRLAAGDYDWSHIAMKYWPERVKEKCKTNKSFAIAHGHEEWYQG